MSPPPAAAPTTSAATSAAAATPAADATPTAVVSSDSKAADPTALVSGESTAEAPAEPTAPIDRPSEAEPTEAEPTAKVTAAPDTSGDGTTNVDDEPTVVDGPPVAPEQRKPTTPTSLMPPVSPAGRAAVPPSDGTKPNNTRRNLLIGAVVALLLIGLVVVVPMLTKGDGKSPQANPTGAAATSAPAPTTAAAPPPPTSGAPSPSASATPSVDPNVLPAGWKLHRDPEGFALPIPDGWVRRNAGRNTVVFDQSNGPGELLVQWTSTPKKDAYADWKSIEGDRKNEVINYQYLSIERCNVGRTCADWEWLETRDNTRIHVRNRGFVTAKDRGYALRWEVADKDWQAKLPDFDRIAKGFVPDRQD
ncbi:Glycoprotein gp2 [Micromonospora saelicesensis]|nr:Glycoprotein gp2 [Micromonospora saelicesensis]